MKFGVTLSNRGVLVGLTTPADLLKLADAVEASPQMDSVWCGDALFVNRRLDALTLLAAVAGRTERVLLGPACMGSFALRDPWCSPTNGPRSTCSRTAAPGWSPAPAAARGRCGRRNRRRWAIKPDDRRKHMIENMHVLRHLWTKDNAPFEGQFVKFAGLTLEPKPVQNPCPIWLATNAERLSHGQADSGGSDFALRRVGRVADGWMTHSVSPEGFQKSWEFILNAGREQGRDMSGFDHVLYHHINVNDDRDAALANSKKFLDLYYTANYSKERLEAWLTYGTPRDCIEHLKRYKAHGCRRVTFRISTMGDPMAQLRRVTEEVLPFV